MLQKNLEKNFGCEKMAEIKKFQEDCYVSNMDLFVRHRNYVQGIEQVVDLNHAALTRPYEEVFTAVHTKDPRQVTALEARVKAARIVNLPDPTRVLFGRNTTEVLNFAYWISGVEGHHAVTSTVENGSVLRLFIENRDHGNTDGEDGWSTFPDQCIAEGYTGFNSQSQKTVEVTVVDYLRDRNLDAIVDAVQEDTKLVLVSHVVRNDGQVTDIMDLARAVKAKNSDCYLVIDGAQALGNIDEVDFDKLEEAGVDFYAATPHKTMGSYPIGLLYMSERAAKKVDRLKVRSDLEQVIMTGMIDPVYGVTPNVDVAFSPARYLSLVTAVETLEDKGLLGDNDFSGKVEEQEQLKQYFLEQAAKRSWESVEVNDKQYSSAITAGRFSGVDNQNLVHALQNQNIFVSYTAETDSVRVSFDAMHNSTSDVDVFFDAVSEYQVAQERITSSENVVPLNFWKRNYQTVAAVAVAAMALVAVCPSSYEQVEVVDSVDSNSAYCDYADYAFRVQGDWEERCM